MESWFIAAICGAVLAGVSNFCFKIAAKRNYNSELFTLYGALVSVAIAVTASLVMGVVWQGYGLIAWVTVLAGIIASTGGIMKPYALRHIDATLFFPLFKLISPALAVIAGTILFHESFSGAEWLGIVLGLTVPLLLINKIEHSRQSNLIAGLVLVALTAIVSAAAAILNKYAIEVDMPFLAVLFYTTIGVLVGSVGLILYKQGVQGVVRQITRDSSKNLVLYATIRATLACASLALALFAYVEGSLGIIQTIHSMYILIPIVLAIIFYNEHWNLQKAFAITLSVASLALLG